MRYQPRNPHGTDLRLGTIASAGKELLMSRKARSTDLFICGSTGPSKSKFLKHLIRQDILPWPRSE